MHKVVIVMSDDSARFIQIYSNLPLKIREEIIAVIDNKPVSWSVAFQEIVHGTKKGEEILKKLREMKIVD